MANPITEFLLFCSGATRAILKMDGCEVERNKYAGIGATILFTAALATLSGGYAMFTVFQEDELSIAFGLLWGVIIFNLDRFIVSSLRKPKLSPTKNSFAWLMAKLNEFWKAVPRLLLALFISIVITKPVELRLFRVEIADQMEKAAILERTKREQAINTEYADINDLEQSTEKLRGRHEQLENERNRRIMAASGELKGWYGTERAGPGPQYFKRQDEVRKAEADLSLFEKNYLPVIQANEEKIKQRKEERDKKVAEIKESVNNTRGLLKQLEALSALSSEHMAAALANIFIILLFISVETAPIFVKLLSPRGPYDDYLDAIEHQVYATQRKKISDTNDEINTSVALSKQLNLDRMNTELQLSKQLNAERVAAELQLNKDTMASLESLAGNDLQDAKLEMAKKVVATWRNGLSRLMSYQTIPATHSGPYVPSNGAGVPANPGGASQIATASATSPSASAIISANPNSTMRTQLLTKLRRLFSRSRP